MEKVKEYTLCAIFDESGENVLLEKKHRTNFNGRLNFPGGKVESDENPEDANAREVSEETGIKKENLLSDYAWIMTLDLPYDCSEGREKCKCRLHYYAGVLKDNFEPKQLTDEELCWVNVEDVLKSSVKDKTYAGNGDLMYVLNVAHIKLFGHEDYYN